MATHPIYATYLGIHDGDGLLDDATRDVEKYETLSDKGFLATETLRKAKVRREIARSTLAKAESALGQAKAQLTYADIASPADGVVVASTVPATPGVLVKPN